MGQNINFKLSSVGIKKEAVESVYEETTAATDYIEVKEGFVPDYSKEELEAEILTGTREKSDSRNGLESVALSLGVELKASETEGEFPQALSDLFEGLLGQERQVAVASTTSTGHTANTIELALGDGALYSVGDSLVAKIAGDYHSFSIESITGDQLTVMPSYSAAFPDSMVISKSATSYIGDNPPSLSAEVNYGNGNVKDKVAGLRVGSATIGIEAGQFPVMDFALTGSSLTRHDEAPNFNGDFSSLGEQPVAINACMYIKYADGFEEELSYSSANLNLENEISDKLDACSESGKLAPIVGQITISGDVNPYMLDNSEAQVLRRYNTFENGEAVSIFMRMQNPNQTSGETKEHVLIYMPKVKFTQIPAGNNNGIMVDQISFRALKTDNENESFFISFV